MLQIFKHTLSNKRTATLSSSLALMIFGLLYASLFKSMSGQIDSIMSNLPPSTEAVFGGLRASSTPEGWLNLELFSLFAPFIIAINATVFGSSAIGQEENDGTIELLMASPVSRTQLVLEKIFAIFAQSLIISIFVFIGIVMGKYMFAFDVSLINMFWSCFALLLFGNIFGGLGFMIQAISGEKSMASGLTASILVLTYLAFVLSKILDSLDKLKFISPFYYLNADGNLFGIFNLSSFLVLLVLPLLLVLISIKGFKSRDINH